MASRLTTILCNQEIAGSTPAVVIHFCMFVTGVRGPFLSNAFSEPLAAQINGDKASPVFVPYPSRLLSFFLACNAPIPCRMVMKRTTSNRTGFVNSATGQLPACVTPCDLLHVPPRCTSIELWSFQVRCCLVWLCQFEFAISPPSVDVYGSLDSER